MQIARACISPELTALYCLIWVYTTVGDHFTELCNHLIVIVIALPRGKHTHDTNTSNHNR